MTFKADNLIPGGLLAPAGSPPPVFVPLAWNNIGDFLESNIGLKNIIDFLGSTISLKKYEHQVCLVSSSISAKPATVDLNFWPQNSKQS